MDGSAIAPRSSSDGAGSHEATRRGAPRPPAATPDSALVLLARASAVLSASLEPDLPWHRVVRADGSLAKGDRQAELLRAEGVPFLGRHRVDMTRAAWVPPAP